MDIGIEGDEAKPLDPLFLKKKRISAEKERMWKKLMQELSNCEANVHEVLSSAVDKSEALVSHHENHLEIMKSQKIETVELTKEMIDPEYSEFPDDPENKDEPKGLEHLNRAIDRCLQVHHQLVSQLAATWFDTLNKEFDGEVDTQTKQNVESQPVSNEFNFTNAFWIMIVVFVLILNVTFVFYGPEDVEKCMDEPAAKCFLNKAIEFSHILIDKYLGFHNITI